MRSITSVVSPHQTLSSDAASALKHSLTLARRRGHAQVTPLHVASTLLTSRSTLLRRACMKSQSNIHQHPLQCRALELCFNVALNRLPATPGPLLQAQPSLSNALVAALKRAQAHQRRGCVEQQQHNNNNNSQSQPLVAAKVDLEQLTLSILDDPSVSRVMREAGFNSVDVKNCLEDCSTNSVFNCYNGISVNSNGGIYSTPNSPPNEGFNGFWQKPLLFRGKRCDLYSVKEVLDVLVRKKRRNVVIVGDGVTMCEGLVMELMGKVERGEISEELRGLSFVKFEFSNLELKLMRREDVEMNVSDLKRKIESFACLGGKGKVIVYVGDLKWTVEIESGCDEYNRYSSPVDHLISELGKLVSWYDSCESNIRVWLMGTANYQTYIKCQMKQPPLDVQWGLQSVSVPSGGLGLSLSGATSGQDPRIKTSQNPSQDLDKKQICVKEDQEVLLTCCQECKLNYEKVLFKSTQHKLNKDTETGSPQMPYWLQSHGSLDKDGLVQLRRAYNKMCQSIHQGQGCHNSNNSSPVTSNQGYFGRSYLHNSQNEIWPKKNSIFADPDTISFAYPAVKLNQSASPLPRFRRQQSCHIEFSFSDGGSKCQPAEPNLDSLKSMDGKEVKITLALGSSIYGDESKTDKNVRSELCNMVRENVPWQSETIPIIIDALVGFEMNNGQDKFVLIKGNDWIGKRRFARGVAKSMFGSSELLFCMNMRSNANSATQNCETLEKALRNHEKLVVFVENFDYANPEFVKYLENGYEKGKLEKDVGCAIFILTVDGDTSYNKAGEEIDYVIQMKLVSESTVGSGIPNADNKRKADWESPVKTKARKNIETEEVSLKTFEYTRKLSSLSLDLNMKADEVTIKQQNLLRFLSKIKNCFVFNRDSDQDEKARGMFTSKLKSAFAEASGSTISFNIDEIVLEEILRSSRVYLNDLFDQWLKDVFQTGMKTVDMEKRDKVSIRLCLDGNGENCAKDGYMGTCLPKRIKVSFLG